jgi:hypothetical protein
MLFYIPKFDQRNEHVIVKSGYPMDRDGWRVTCLRLLAGIRHRHSASSGRDQEDPGEISGLSAQFEVPEFLEVFSRPAHTPPERIKAFEDHLDDFEAFCRQNSIDLVYVYLPLSDSYRLNEMLRQIGEDPADYDTSFYEELMQSYCVRVNKELVSLSPVLREHYMAGRELRFKLDPHFNVFANRVIGEYLIKAIL